MVTVLYSLSCLIDSFCNLLQFKGEMRKKCISQLLILIGHSFPIVSVTSVTFRMVINLTISEKGVCKPKKIQMATSLECVSYYHV